MRNLFASFLLCVTFGICSAQTVDQDNVRPVDELNQYGVGEGYPWLSPDGLSLYYTSGAWGYTYIYKATRTTTAWGQSGSIFGSTKQCQGFPPGSYSAWLTPDQSKVYFCVYTPTKGNTAAYYSVMGATLVNGDITKQFSISLVGITQNCNDFVGDYSCGFKLNTFVCSPCIDFNNYLYISINDGIKNDIIMFTEYGQNYGQPEYYYYDPTSITKYIAFPSSGQFSSGMGNKFDISISNQLGTSYAIQSIDLTNFINTYGNHNNSPQLNSRFGTTNQSDSFNIQPSTNGDRTQLVFVKNSQNDWDFNDLYLSSNTTANQNFRKEDIGANATVGATGSAMSSTMVYPNPAKNGFYVRTEAGSSVELRLYDLLGNMVLVQAENGQGPYYVDTSQLSNGLYQCLVNTDGNKSYHKIIINN